ncbi:MAG: enoyl-CoA hydratase-related protein [Alphaproteobacteria bacterium]|jgi:enoyl-CoA hydratase|nr:enoyl-CoA hydratase [Rhodospirillaceae bacterium]MDP6023611.1 enoyl-CoA hydratase-related protein [Alphaproteobacteria bacterium]MDP6256883.1 enoyl-CoA hydratase-related protein [Alphaproteobacteria bacterium]MDP7054539.1 enoyl-CoA hydratase-related protein [Alphaproteobacteria bacterium]MDP7227052.1 enoyl-CoA hydratase-related protein [Alphaproteobacteria bacterium]|tara:strand:+ start:8154 stop:8960 length:807 start_codon:yes stop_codon:yes gene_type:complete
MSVLEVEFSDGIARVRLNRPEARNALNPELIVALADCWSQLQGDDDVRVVVLTGAAGSTFCAGFDLGRFIPLLTGAREAEDEWDRAVVAEPELPARATLRDLDLGRPLIVAANGHAIAGGMEMLLAGDLRVVATGARLGLSEVKLGLIPAMGGTARLARLVSPALAAEMLLTGNPIDADGALAAGLVNYVVSAEKVEEVALELAATIADNAPLAVRAARKVMRRAADLSEVGALALESAEAVKVAASEDAQEGPRAFMEKRPPVFKGV